MRKLNTNTDIPKLAVLQLKDSFVSKINTSDKIKITDKVILVGEDEEYVYFIDLLNNKNLKNEDKPTVIILEDEPLFSNNHVDLELIYRTKLETLAENIKYFKNTNEVLHQYLNYDNQIKILRNLIRNLDEKSKNLPKVVNIIKKFQKHNQQWSGELNATS